MSGSRRSNCRLATMLSSLAAACMALGAGVAVRLL